MLAADGLAPRDAPCLWDVVRITYALIGQWCTSYRQQPDAVVLDIDDSYDVVHGQQQLSLFNAYYDERCFLPIHIYDTERSRSVAVILRPGKTPSGVKIRGHLRRLVRRIRRHWPTTRIAGTRQRRDLITLIDDRIGNDTDQRRVFQRRYIGALSSSCSSTDDVCRLTHFG